MGMAGSRIALFRHGKATLCMVLLGHSKTKLWRSIDLC